MQFRYCCGVVVDGLLLDPLFEEPASVVLEPALLPAPERVPLVEEPEPYAPVPVDDGLVLDPALLPVREPDPVVEEVPLDDG
jgi:hypothetical protein